MKVVKYFSVSPDISGYRESRQSSRSVALIYLFLVPYAHSSLLNL